MEFDTWMNIAFWLFIVIVPLLALFFLGFNALLFGGGVMIALGLLRTTFKHPED